MDRLGLWSRIARPATRPCGRRPSIADSTGGRFLHVPAASTPRSAACMRAGAVQATPNTAAHHIDADLYWTGGSALYTTDVVFIYVMMERAVETTPRPHHGDPKPGHVFRHAVAVTSAAFTVAMQTGPKDGFSASHRPCHRIRDDTIKADTIQAAIRAVPACAPYRAMSLHIRNGCAGRNYTVKTGPGRSRESGAGAGLCGRCGRPAAAGRRSRRGTYFGGVQYE